MARTSLVARSLGIRKNRTAADWRGHAGVKLLEKLKGGGNWKVGDTHQMGVFRRAGQTIRSGDQFILVFDDRQL